MTKEFDKVQEIVSTSSRFGEITRLSADNKIMIVFSNLKSNSATVDIYSFDSVAGKFSFERSQIIQSDGGLDGDVVLAQNGSYFIIGSKQKYNAKALLYRINITDKKILPIYKVCDFALTGVTEYGAYRVVASPSSDYLTLSDGRNYTEAFVWDSDIRNFRSITQFHYPDEVEKHAFAKNTTIVPRPILALSDDGENGTLIRYKRHAGGIVSDTTDLVAYAVKPSNMMGKNNTATDYKLSGDKEELDAEDNNKYHEQLVVLRCNYQGLIVVPQLFSFILNSNGTIKTDVRPTGYIVNNDVLNINYNGGLIGSFFTYIIALRVKQGSFSNGIGIEEYGVLDTDDETVVNFSPSGSDAGFYAVPVLNKTKNTYTLRIYKAKNYPNFYVPSGYPTIADKDLPTGEQAEVIDTDKFLITITYKN